MSMYNKVITFVVPIQSEQEGVFTDVTHVDKQYIPQALRLAALFNPCVDVVNKTYDYAKANQIATDNGLPIVAAVNQTVYNQTAEVQVMLDKVLSVLKATLGALGAIEDPALIGALTTAIQNTFLNLQSQESGAWILWKSEEAHKTTYLYQVMFGIQNADTGAVMLICPVSFYIEANMSKHELFGITTSSNESFSVQMQSITVAQALQTPDQHFYNVFSNKKVYQNPILSTI
ncbi:toxin [Thermoactinomyces sp. DSM 45891]|uniref:hypothetical protein n=1 Tax=Thermoactinomyces sp. DSM 45891 TaxID=1761907 RepID=UPI00091F0E47|nr:hypothetical protein [Thermoactinomyces sp. DSM 45891]SFX34731.1 toxin [Thermoactinomyces sp. DSM 45891]